MPRILQYLGDASYSIYLWHTIVFIAVAAVFAHLGWVGVVDRTLLATLMGIIGLGAGLLSYHFLEKPSLKLFGEYFIGRGVHATADSASIGMAGGQPWSNHRANAPMAHGLEPLRKDLGESTARDKIIS